MPINQTIARLSDLSFQSAFAVYLLALVLLIWHYAATRTDHVHRFELGSRKLVAAGGVSAPSPEVPGRIVSAPPKPVPERLGNMGAAVLVVGLGLHLVSIVLRGFATGRFPLGNMYEFVTMATAAATATGIVFLRGQTYRAMWVFLLAPVLILMFVAATLLYADAAPVVPALQSYWLPIHVTIVSIGSGVFLVSGVASLAFLLRIRQPAGAERRGPVGSMARRLPDAQTLDRLAYRTVIVGFPLFGIGVILGAIWAEAAWGRFWGWDPKETMSFIAWVIYAAYLHARATAGWRETKAAWINIAGFVSMLFNLFIINMVVSGLHSYAGLS
ncbi:c-type cytochrome biogenesis protein CcsB (plasmid) [Rhodococcus erythropolis]|uniref:C-type cytochrome biogenesis protein CcsB n=1 Tax=Rhodococcus baikonurensis TaxID=172041 RepID=A0ABV5XSM7_9NOCA|nr:MULTISPECIES: c-type cytochrome biogenesis protein CcsB [Rhodococcus]NHP17184.1 c-type cytochrome biogenesis protein CcsB [Rhodococcus sp. IC4_135]ANQ75529.1 c-type cytochrome biogenesis protein CcsB [Rhodococcus sp. 008]KLN70190.1 cytochrome C assembly protein [Rhodococcus erythropolis]KSU69076.1 cytochrome C assembly protein [Rhodococcus qingshengii]KZF15964.1 c-type cytochrome biogenesis protein CcsB [Rhodococcus sp. EPR-134]